MLTAPPGIAFTTRTSAMSFSSTASAGGAVDVLLSDFDVTAPVSRLSLHAAEKIIAPVASTPTDRPLSFRISVMPTSWFRWLYVSRSSLDAIAARPTPYQTTVPSAVTWPSVRGITPLRLQPCIPPVEPRPYFTALPKLVDAHEEETMTRP